MARGTALTMVALMRSLADAGPAGVSPAGLEKSFPDASRSTLNRRLRDLCAAGRVKAIGKGRSTRYASAAPFPEEDVVRYFATDWQDRPAVGFREEQLLRYVQISC